jgi:hypothetical protein
MSISACLQFTFSDAIQPQILCTIANGLTFICTHNIDVYIYIHMLYTSYILSRVWVTTEWVWIGDSIYWPLTQQVTLSNYNSLTGLHNLKVTVTEAHKKSSVFTSRFLVTDPIISSVNVLTGWRISHNWLRVWVLCYDRRSVGQSALEKSTHLGLTTKFLLLSDSYGFVDVGRSLWREVVSVVYNCCWSSPAQSFSGPSPVGLATIFYCPRFETSLFVASYDSQSYGWGIRPRLHTGLVIYILVYYFPCMTTMCVAATN